MELFVTLYIFIWVVIFIFDSDGEIIECRKDAFKDLNEYLFKRRKRK